MVPTKSMLADFLFFFWPPSRPNASNLTWQKSLFANGFWRSLQRCPRIWIRIFFNPILITDLDFEVFYRPDLDLSYE